MSKLPSKKNSNNDNNRIVHGLKDSPIYCIDPMNLNERKGKIKRKQGEEK